MHFVRRYPLPFLTVSLHTLLFLLCWWEVVASGEGEAAEGMILFFQLIDWPVSLVTLNGVSGIMPRHLLGIALGGGLQWLLIGMAVQFLLTAVGRLARGE